MNKKHIIGILIVIVILAIGFLIYKKLHISARVDAGGKSVSVIGGADGPTAVFIAGKGGGEDMASYKSISMDEAKEVFAQEGDYIILDVRRGDEFDSGHIPGAINIANEDIVAKEPEELPDKEQMIYVYCRSGRRSKEAAAKLAALGYTNIVECGGILDWTGEVSC